MAKVTIQNASETSGSATLVAARNRNRKWIMVQADLANTIPVAIGFSKDVAYAATDADAGIVLEPGKSISFPDLSNLNTNNFALFGVHGGADDADPIVRFLDLT